MAEDWRSRAACTAEDDADWLFFPISSAPEAFEAGKAVCRACPVRAECLDLALQIQPRDGLWAGLTADELRPLYRRTP